MLLLEYNVIVAGDDSLYHSFGAMPYYMVLELREIPESTRFHMLH
jgi:hypothetical protein